MWIFDGFLENRQPASSNREGLSYIYPGNDGLSLLNNKFFNNQATACPPDGQDA